MSFPRVERRPSGVACRAACVGVVAFVIAACGSTAPASRASFDRVDGADGVADDVLRPGQQFGNVAGGGPRAQPGGAASVPASVFGTATPGRAVVPQAQAPVGPGVTDDAVFIGLAYSDNGGAAAAAVGAEGAAASGSRRRYDALIAEINAAGGVAGRRLVPRYFVFDAATSETFQQQEQRACSLWTEDNKVFAVLGGGDAQMRACTKAAGVLHVGSLLSMASTETFRTSPNYVEPSGVNLDRVGQVTVGALARTDYFSGKPKVGLLTWDMAEYRHGMSHGWLPALRRQGITVDAADVYYVAPPNNVDDLTAASAALGNAAVKFRADGVDHVLIADGPAGITSGAGLTLLWLNAARSQRYFPRYGLNTTSSPQGGLDGGYYQPEDFQSASGPAVVLGWDSVLPADEVGVPRNRARLRCLEVMRKHGVAVPDDQAVYVLGECDVLFFLQAVLARVAGRPTLPSAVAAINAFGTSYASPSIYAARLSAAQHDGAAKARLSRFDPACSCFRFTTGLFEI